jgi:hypothetical protein
VTARVRLLSEYEAAVLSVLRLRAWWEPPWVSDAQIIRAAQLYRPGTPARTIRHHLARFSECGVLEHDEKLGYRWAAQPAQAEALEAAAAVEGLSLAPVVDVTPVGPIHVELVPQLSHPASTIVSEHATTVATAKPD